jgi:ATP-dependent Clp protease protease subunit
MNEPNKISKEEVQANVIAKLAEAKKLEAEAKKAEAGARKLAAEASRFELEYYKAHEEHRRNKCKDEENFLYRFAGVVDKGSVNKCMTRLTQWSRLSPGCDIEIVFSSPGGSIVDGFELFDFLQELRLRGHKLITGSLGMAASMAGILLQAGDVRWVGHQSWLMIHRAAFGAIGKTFEIEDEVEFVKRIEERIVDIFTTRSNLTKQKIKKNWDRRDWWISADEAVELRLVDEVRAMMPEAKRAKSRAITKVKTTPKKKAKKTKK